MDGNGRWATRRGLPRQAGHAAGVEAIRRVVEAAPDLGVGTLTLYAFSADNWRRPEAEVRALMGLLRRYLRDRDRAPRPQRRAPQRHRPARPPARRHPAAIARAERETAGGTALHLRVAVDYSARDAILAAAAAAAPRAISRARASRACSPASACLQRRRPPDPHRRRAAAVGFPALGVRLRRALLHGAVLARLRRRAISPRRWPGSAYASAASAGSAARRSPPPDPAPNPEFRKSRNLKTLEAMPCAFS